MSLSMSSPTPTLVNSPLTSHASQPKEQQLSMADLERGYAHNTTHILLSHQHSAPSKPTGAFTGQGKSFWLVFSALCVASFLAALDLTSVATILPTLAADLNSNKFTWIGSAYALASTAVIPWVGGLASIFGRRSCMLGSLVFFAVGSGVTGGARSMAVAIAGRSIQGVGGGGILIMTDIIVCDLLPLAHRGPLYSVLALCWAVASAIGPTIGGALATTGNWRWLFYLNIPITATAMVLVGLFFKIKTPQTSWKEKMAQMDYANLIFVASISAVIFALSSGGTDYAWKSAAVIAPIVLGTAGLALFLWVEKELVAVPTIPFAVLTHRNSLCGYIACFTQGLLVLIMAYYLPTWFQSVLGASAVKSGVDLFALAFPMAAGAILAGVSVRLFKHYLTQSYVGWVITIIGFGVMTLIGADSPKALAVVCPLVAGVGLGVTFVSPRFATMAPLNVEQHAHATSFFNFVRSFGQVMGIVIGSTVLSNRLGKTLPMEFLEKYGAAAELAIPSIHLLEEPLRDEVRKAFADSLRTVFFVALGISFIGLLATCGMQSIAMAEHKDDNWGLEGESLASSNSSTAYSESDNGDEAKKVNEKGSATPGAYSPNLSTMDFPISLA